MLSLIANKLCFVNVLIFSNNTLHIRRYINILNGTVLGVSSVSCLSDGRIGCCR